MRKLFTLIFVVLTTTYNAFSQHCYAVYADDNVVLVAAEQKLYRSTDNAKTFSHILPAGEDNIAVRCITKVNNTIIIGGLNGDNRIFRSTDNGQTWSVAKTGMPDIYGYSSAIPAKALTVGNKVYMGGTNFFRVSDDEGLTWKTMSIDPATGSIAYTGGKLWHSSAMGGPALKYSTDLGANWQAPAANPNTYGYPAVGFVQFDDTLIVLTGENGTSGIKRSSDGGTTWETVANSLQLGLSMIEVNGVLYACDYNGFHKSTNNGLIWTNECGSFQYHVYGGKLHTNGDDIWMASANGAIRYNMTKGTCEVINLSATSILSESIPANNINIFPNPAQTFVNISNAQIGAVLKITDVTGKEIYKNIIKEEQAVISIENFVNGVYIIQIENNGMIANSKLVVNR
ncbi:MAG: T9SS type A sorting domain-containing protein [Bacteroidia bacterium]